MNYSRSWYQLQQEAKRPTWKLTILIAIYGFILGVALVGLLIELGIL